MATPAEMEFGNEEEQVEEQAGGKVAAPDHSADITSLKGENARLASELEGLKSRTAIINKLQEAFGVKNEDPKDVLVRKEIKRLVPEIDDLSRIKELLPEILVTLQAAAEEGTAVKAATAQDFMRELMDSIGLDSKDDEAVSDLEEVLTKEIKRDKALLALWARGNVKSAVQRAFEKAEKKLFAPVRAHTKRSAVKTSTDAPRTIRRDVGAPTPPAAKKQSLDFTDTSRDGVKKVHDAAFERLQELLDA